MENAVCTGNVLGSIGARNTLDGFNANGYNGMFNSIH